MRFTQILPLLAISAFASAAPSPSQYTRNTCLSQSVATALVNDFVSLLTSFSNTTATALLAPDFKDESDSINYLGGYPLGITTFPSKAAFIAGQGSQPPIGLQVLAIDAYTCNGVIVFRWVAAVGDQALEVKGINVMYASLKGRDCNGVGPNGWQLDQVYSEFNSAAWIVDIGGSCPSPAGQA